MATATDPKSIAQAWLQTFERKDFDAWATLAHNDLVMRIHFAPPGLFSHGEGRETCLAAVGEFFQAVATWSWIDLSIYATDEPGIVMATTRSKVETVFGTTYENQYVFKLTVTDGQVKIHEEYFNPLPAIEAFNLSADTPT